LRQSLPSQDLLEKFERRRQMEFHINLAGDLANAD